MLHVKVAVEQLGRKEESKKEIEYALKYVANHPTYSEKGKAISKAEWMKELGIYN